ncbi:MAG TPA: hypothetical protein VND99_03905 [Candidatus Acidoferrales bacterium]|nr:hypothetical protein [Candidatus Acidoferrales bacterium]
MNEEEKKKKHKVTIEGKPENAQEGEIVADPSAPNEIPATEHEQAPEEEATPPVVDTSPILAEIEKLWKENRFLEKKVEFISNTNWLIVIVLFVGFLILLFSLLTVFIESNNNASAIQVEFIKSVTTLQNDVNNLNDKLNQATSSANNSK